MKQKALIAIAVLICIAFATTGISYAVSPQQQATAYANKAFIDEGWQYLCVEDWEGFEFKNPEQATKTYLGEPLSYYYIDHNIVFEQSILQQAKEVAGYIFPVIVDGEIYADLRVDLRNGKWVVVSLSQSTGEIYAAAKANSLDVNECYIVFAPIEVYLITNTNGTEIGVAVFNNDDSFKMNTENIDKLKQKFKHNREYSEEIQMKYKGQPIPVEEIRYGATTGVEYPESFEQSDSVVKRVWNYMYYICNK